jgi:plastocyanin
MTSALEFEDTFEGEALDRGRWLPQYLPHWSNRERSAARYEIADGHLRLLIEEDQQPWCPDLDGQVRVSSLQTGAFAGPVGSTIGQHRSNPAAVVRDAPPNVRLEPHRLELPAGEEVEIEITNEGGTTHDLTIEALGLSTGPIEPAKVVTAAFAVPEGETTFMCSIHGGMDGVVVGS